jgi:multidrug efflux pump subunit AcrB
LAHSKARGDKGMFSWLERRQQSFSRGFERLIRRWYVPSVRFAARRRYLTLAAGIATLVITVGLVAGGRVEFVFFPKIDGDVIIASAELPYGTSVEKTRELEQMMLDAAGEILDDSGGTARISRGIYSQVGSGGLAARGDPGRAARPGGGGSSIAEVAIFLVESSERSILTSEFAHRWREMVESKAHGLEGLSFEFGMGPPVGSGVHVQLNHTDVAVLERAAADLAKRVAGFTGVYDIDDGFAAGKRQLDFKLTPEGRSLGLSEIDLARQVRASFFGAEAVRQQRGRDEIRTYVRLPLDERDSEYNVEELIIRTPRGGEIPMAQAATIDRGRSYTEINRIDGRRAVTVTAEVDHATGNPNDINAALVKETLPSLLEDYPGLSYTFGGEQQQQAETMESLGRGFTLALVGMFALLAVAFRSYIQPLIVLLAIPFGFVGAVWGHLIMGYELSLMSMMGVVALAGVVVNDSLILVVAINRYREAGMDMFDAVAAGGERRFRPILLTSLTTFFGLAPMIVETSVQAKFLIPMAVSLGFGVIFATFITLVLVPAAYVALDDAQRTVGRVFKGLEKKERPQQPSTSATGDVG